ncbi:unnamed protein product [Pleuronectes platessa]|uniref:Uncharacterized protein n=1 Tax=Pleuronectes platessa TaxID=8262 RepID=A0A9N7VPX6_PLEPL|nr:unnamed protein product [Pleuronectes platessa]
MRCVPRCGLSSQFRGAFPPQRSCPVAREAVCRVELEPLADSKIKRACALSEMSSNRLNSSAIIKPSFKERGCKKGPHSQWGQLSPSPGEAIRPKPPNDVSSSSLPIRPEPMSSGWFVPSSPPRSPHRAGACPPTSPPVPSFIPYPPGMRRKAASKHSAEWAGPSGHRAIQAIHQPRPGPRLALLFTPGNITTKPQAK